MCVGCRRVVLGGGGEGWSWGLDGYIIGFWVGLLGMDGYFI